MRPRRTFRCSFVFTVFSIASTQFMAAQENPRKKVEVLLCGTMHYVPDSQQQNWDQYRKFLMDYRPDAICVEYRMPGDSISLMHADGINYRRFLDSIGKVWNADTLNADNRLKALYAALRQQEDWAKRIELFQLLYLRADFSNADFQAWRAHQLISVLPEDQRKEIRVNYPVYKRMEWLVSKAKNNEYSNIVFPLAVAFKIDYLFPVDDRTYNEQQSIAYTTASGELEGTAFENKANAFWEEFTKTQSTELARGNALLFINSATWQKKSDYGQTALYLSSGNRHYKEYVKYWNARNEQVGVNIIEQITGTGFKRVAVFMGYMHIPNMKKHMKKRKDILLKTISDY